MSHKYYHNFRGDDILKFISCLTTLDKNSSFCYRLMFAQLEAYTMWRRGKCDWAMLDGILANGNPQMEDPQEMLFIETVNSPFRSYKVFSTFYLTHKVNLSQLLYLADRVGIAIEKISIVYALLELSDIIINRCGYGRYVKGYPAEEKVLYPNYKEYASNKDRTSFSTTEMQNVLAQNGLHLSDIDELLLNIKKGEIKKEIQYQGHSDAFELHPLLKLHDGSYLVLFPSALIRTAYVSCYGLLQNIFGKDKLLELLEDKLVEETGAILKNDQVLFLKRTAFRDIPSLWFDFDNDKVTNVMTVLADRNKDLAGAISDAEKELGKEYPGKKIFLLIVTLQMDERGIFLTCPVPVTSFNIEDFKIVMNQDRMSLLNLYYYNEDKKKVNLSIGSQEIDNLSFYIDNGFTFYRDNTPDLMCAAIGNALTMRSEYLSGMDEHIVDYAPQNSAVLVHHFADIPKNIPIYSPYMSEKGFYMLQLMNHELWMYIASEEQDFIFFREIVVSCFNWLYAAQYKKGITPLIQTTHVELSALPDGKIEYRKANEDTLIFCIPMTILQGDVSKLEYSILSAFVDALRNCGFASEELSLEVINDMFSENSGQFLLVADERTINVFDENDGVASCYFVNKRYCDIILQEIADYLKLKGKGLKPDFIESKDIMICVSTYILDEIKKIITSVDTEMLLKRLLELHHAMVYWSKLTQGRYDTLSKAYSYVDATFDNQFQYVNEYSEMNILTQGLIEAIILNDIHYVGGMFNLETIDRLFALMHFNVNMGSYMDQLGEKIPGCELVILKNGRLGMPVPIIDKLNSYFLRLRTLSMNELSSYEKLFALMPRSSMDIDDPVFITAFKAEFGISFEQYRNIIFASIDYARKEEKPIMVMAEVNFYDIVAKGVLGNDDIQAFKKHFVLQASLKDGLNFSDMWLQRFNRPVQMTARPWVLFDDNIYYTTKTVYESWTIRTERLSNGTIIKNSSEMNRFVSKVNNSKGHDFTMGIRAYYESLGLDYLYVNSEVEIMPGKLLDATKNLGDIDVLLINKKTKCIVCIEAKNFVESRTVYELIQQNKKIVTKELSHVVKRDKWCQLNISKFKKFVPEVDDQYSVKTIFLTYHENAYNYFDHDDDQGLTYLSAMDIIESPLVVF